MAVDWGSVPDWLAGSGALLALIFAWIAALAARRTNHIQSLQIQELQEENRQRRLLERRQMASRVSVYLVTEDTPSGKQPIVRFVNANPGPIYGLHVFCFTPTRVVDRRYYVNGPHPERVRMGHLTEKVRELVGPAEAGDLISQGLLVAACSFRDPAGIWWYRTPSGELFEASSGEAAAEAARASGPATSSSGAGSG